MSRSRFFLCLLCSVSAGSAVKAEGTYVEVYGSVIPAASVEYCAPRTSCDTYDIERRAGYGLGIYSSTLLPGFDVGVDIMITDGLWAPPYPNDVFASKSIMASLRRNFTLTPELDAFVGFGVDAIAVENSDAGVFDIKTGAGGQIEGGIRYSVTEKVDVYTSYKHQGLFEHVVYEGGLGGSYGGTSDYSVGSVNIGLQFKL